MNKGGERYLKAKAYHRNGECELYRDLGYSSKIVDDRREVPDYVLVPTEGRLDIDKIVHFIVGVCWRNAQVDPEASLGPYDEPIRLFLLGKVALPLEVSIICRVIDQPRNFRGEQAHAHMIPPHKERITDYGCHLHYCLINGLWMEMYVGKVVPAWVGKHCLVRSEMKPIIFTPGSRAAILQQNAIWRNPPKLKK